MSAENVALARVWLRDFELSEAYAALAAPAQQSLPGAVRVMASCFTRRWSRVTETAYPLNEMTAEDAVDVLTEQLPHSVAALDGDSLTEALVELLIWAAKTNRIHNRDVEYACRRSRQDAAAAMKDERKWAPGKFIVMRALRDGIDVTDLDRLRAHAISTGLDPSYVDEFLPPGPTYLRNRGWLWMNE